MTKGIKISINCKRELYLISRNSKNPKLKKYYKLYCKLLSKVIKEAKILQYEKQISPSYNKTKTIWNIVKSETGKKIRKEDTSLLHINGKIIQNQQIMANSFNDYFLKIPEKLMGANKYDKINQLKHGAPLHNILQSYGQPYPSIKFRYTSTEEVERIIKSLKPKNAQGYDEISTKILKWSAPFISSP
jgi:integrase